MKVLYVSKALIVAAYRDKLRALNVHAQVRAVIPERWGSQPIESIEPDGVQIDTCPALLHGQNHLHIYRGIGRILDRDRPDLVHIDEEPYSAAAFQIALLCSRRRLPCLVFAWQNLDKKLPLPFRMMRAAVFDRVAGAIAGTSTAAAVLSRAGFDKPITVIPQFGVDLERYRPDPAARAAYRGRVNAGADDFLIGFGGRLVREKGVHLLIEALRFLPGSCLVIVGDGPERERLAADGERHGLGDRIHFTGPVSSREMPGWLAAFDALALPSLGTSRWKEQFGRILVEAMACEVPIVASDSGEIPKVVGDAGLVLPEGDGRALTSALRELAAAPDLRAELVQAGRTRVRDLYTQERVAVRTAEFYQSLVGSGHRSLETVT